MYCLSVSSPGGLLIPPNFPREIFWGGKRVPAVGAGPRGPRPRPQGPPAMASWAPSYAMASWAPSSAMASFVCLFRSGGPRPVFLSMSVLRGLQSAHPPSLVELLRRGTRLQEGGSYVRVLLCVSCVPASCVHIWFVSCPRLMSLWVNSCPAVFVSLSVINLCILVHACSVWFCLVYLWLPGVSCLSALPCPTLSTLKSIIWVYILVCVFLFLPRVCTVTVCMYVYT